MKEAPDGYEADPLTDSQIEEVRVVLWMGAPDDRALHLLATVDALRAEVERLRGALKQVERRAGRETVSYVRVRFGRKRVDVREPTSPSRARTGAQREVLTDPAMRTLIGFDDLPCELCERKEPCSCAWETCQCSCGRCTAPFPLDDDGEGDALEEKT